ncbi:DUF490 domain-containing protein [Altererythrobacter xixiisoli]|uniref:DUF490 domain-containing protein n=1 Tax=Croceibacterium xixiisoli TaxID=1476466 RepID=A0A6I4TUB3_9SPHN|nr:translocation/assembly module TamB domain-containing protein [Croceibacterium xixiisoli]MXO98168.1 DUF490 domain-containing protein [Croceibacterium xixiisoli]
MDTPENTNDKGIQPGQDAAPDQPIATGQNTADQGIVAQEDPAADTDEPPARRKSHPLVRVVKWVFGAVAALLLLFVAVIAWLHTSYGRQFIVDQISQVAPASGLSVQVGRIEGSVLWSSTLYDVQLRDAQKKLFLEIPEVELNWRPWKFLFTGLDVRHLVLHGGTLYAAPELIAGDPDAPTLPDFDIRVDRFVIDGLRIDKALLGEDRIVSMRAKADIRDGRVALTANGDLGGGDVLTALVDAEPDGNRFDIDLDYRAPAGGLLASLTGATEDMRARILGDGTWTAWNGAMVVTQGDANLAAFTLTNKAGVYRVVGQARPGSYLSGIPATAVGEAVSIAAVGTLEKSVLVGGISMRAAGIDADGRGTIDLGNNLFRNFVVETRLLNPELLGDAVTLRDARAKLVLDGPFRELVVPHEIFVGEANASGTVLTNITQKGTLSFSEDGMVLPVDITAERIVSGVAMVDPRLRKGTVRGTITLRGDQLNSDDLAVNFPGLWGKLYVRGDIARGGYAVGGPVELRSFDIANVGSVDAGAKFLFKMGTNVPWTLQANFNGRMPRVTNPTITNIAGTNIRFNGGVQLGANQPILFRRTTLNASKLSLTLDGQMQGSRTTVVGSGRHVDYGPFTVEAELADDGPRATLVLASPYPAAGLKDVRVSISPTAQGFAIETEGQSTLGPFDGLLELISPPDGPTLIAIERMNIWKTQVTGGVTLGDAGIDGQLKLTGGGMNGTIGLDARAEGQGFAVDLDVLDANFAGATPISIRQANIDATGLIGPNTTTVNGTMSAAGLSYGTFFLGRLQAKAALNDGVGSFDVSLAGRRGSRFALDITGTASADRIAVAARGDYAGRRIYMPRRAVLDRGDDGSWTLQKTQLSFGRGIALLEGRYGGDQPTQGTVSLSRMPLSLLDIMSEDLAVGGTVSGIIDVQMAESGNPVGDARIMVNRLSRSGLVTSSRPIDVALVGRLSDTQLQLRAMMKDEGTTKGRLQARIANMPVSGAMFDRLNAGDLFAQLRYDGPAEALWRLAAIELIDITGPIRVAADVTGSISQPTVRGSLAGDALRVQSALTGSDIRNARARGTFSGSRLQLTSFAGTAPNGGAVSGSGFVDLSSMSAERGPQIDLRLATRNAQVMDLPTMGGTVTGPLRIVSNGVGGTIAGRLNVNEARWTMGMAAETQELPSIRTREINLPLDSAPQVTSTTQPWRFLIDATAPGGIMVTGMGLDSEWSANVRLRGTTAAPRIGGEARVVPRQGFYSFAGRRFDLTRGVIDFDEGAAIDPRIDILAETELNALTVAVAITGRATKPEISFSSVPALPEEELLAQLLFGGSITDLSATDAVQLGAALASLRGGGGMGPVNKLRSAIGLDRLRILPPDAALQRGTAVALGKRFGRLAYVELITDGQGYTATEAEFRVTSWLSLLGAINSLGRNSVAAEVRHDY